MTEWHPGTLGYSYAEWRGVFYPESAGPQPFLRSYARIFNAVELDTTFDGIPDAARITAWKRQVPKGFVFCPKTPPTITHEGDLSGFPLTDSTLIKTHQSLIAFSRLQEFLLV